MIGVKDIANFIDSMFNSIDTPSAPIPPPLILKGAPLRPGASAIDAAENIISRQSELGIPTGPIQGVSPNLAESMEKIRVEEILKELRTKSKITIVIPPGLPVQATGANTGGPVVCIGTTVTPWIAYGIIE